MDYKKMGIKEIFNLEKLKEKNPKKYIKKMKDQKIHKILTCKTSSKCVKYINRDSNAVKNMSLIVSSYIKNNKKPIPYIIGLPRKYKTFVLYFLERLKFVEQI